jgi:hypothetical protein
MSKPENKQNPLSKDAMNEVSRPKQIQPVEAEMKSVRRTVKIN